MSRNINYSGRNAKTRDTTSTPPAKMFGKEKLVSWPRLARSEAEAERILAKEGIKGAVIDGQFYFSKSHVGVPLEWLGIRIQKREH